MDILLYNCKSCNVEWVNEYESIYGECDDECPRCQKDFTPVKMSRKAYLKKIDAKWGYVYNEKTGEVKKLK